MHSWSETALKECAMVDKTIIYPIETTGLWGEAVRQRRPVITNDYAAPNPLKKGLPEGHAEVRRHMNIPVFDGDRIVAVAGVGNKEEEYNESDVRQLTLLMNAMWWHIKRQREAKALSDEVEHVHLFQSKMIETSNEGIIAHDLDGNIIIFNEGAERILGYRKEEVIGRIPVRDLYPPGVAAEIREKILGSESGGPGRLMQYETVGIRSTGESIPIELSASQIFEHDQEIATVIFFRDLQERKQMQENLLRSERLTAIGRAAAHITHEIKNPLMLIGGFARRVLKDINSDPQKNKEKLQIIVDEVRRLEEFLVEVGIYARLSEPHRQEGDLNVLIKELCLRLDPSLREKDIQLVLSLDPNLPLIQFDHLHLRQVILNIAKNSIEAMGEGGVLTLATENQQYGIIIQIADTGDGIQPEILNKIFQPFYTTKPKGSGLGLAIARKIIEAHKGKITIESEYHKGTRVTILLKQN
jgi:PAS domain S-box-containing protein